MPSRLTAIVVDVTSTRNLCSSVRESLSPHSQMAALELTGPLQPSSYLAEQSSAASSQPLVHWRPTARQ